ncbi:unnamed protein product [Amoebophrya sp. A25]|nr:unnamed protein product [Amoebophrya sp. A25]|eukprot:GSA25T00008505001.1
MPLSPSERKSKLVVEPAVIDLAALQEGCEGSAENNLVEPINFPKVESLRLSYRNIAEIANLNNFDNLKTLRLDNNIIDRIDSLDHLVNLTWLDLSFNNIREIQGLENLVNLEDVSLYNNHIEEISGLDNCKRLNVLSLGRNRISDLKQVNYLRRFGNLRCVCLEGNKICEADSYQQHVLAYLQHLVYLDYMLIDKKQVAQIQESYQLDELTEMKEQEAEEALQQKAEAEKKVHEEKLRQSFLDTTNNLYDDLFPADMSEHLGALHCLTPLKEEYREKLAELLKTLYASVQEKNEERLKKVKVFEKQIEQTYLASEAESTELFKKFLRSKKVGLQKVKEQIVGGILTDEAAEILKRLSTELEEADHDLMDLEMDLLASVDDYIVSFESQMGELIKVMANAAKEFFQFFEETENTFKNDLMLGASTEMEAAASQPEMMDHGEDARRQQLLSYVADKTLSPMHTGSPYTSRIGTSINQSIASINQLVEQSKRGIISLSTTKLSNLVAPLLFHPPDREGMTQALAAFSDSHLLAIQTKDDQMQAQMSGWLFSFFDAKQKHLLQRKGARMMEIKRQIESNQAELKEYLVSISDQMEEEEDD